MKPITTRMITLAAIGCLFANAAFSADKAGAADKAESARKSAYFLKFDADGDQKLSLTEYTEMVRTQLEKKGEKGYQEQAQKRFKRKDANKDGFVTFEEQHGMPMAGMKSAEKKETKQNKEAKDKKEKAAKANKED